MADVRIGGGSFFDKGIDSITYQGDALTPGLPDAHELTPADHSEQGQLNRLLAQPGLDHYLDNAVRPPLPERDLLMPARFRQAMEDTIGHLEAQAQALHQGEPEQVKLLNRALRLLKEERSLRELVQMYRSVLYQG